MTEPSRGSERVLSDLAADQWGLVATGQAASQGVRRSRLTDMVERGTLDRVRRGVYALRGAAAGEHQELQAAWISLQPSRTVPERLRERPVDAVVSHESAAQLRAWGDLPADRHTFTVPRRMQTRQRDIALRLRELPEDEVEFHGGLPMTRIERLLPDLLADGHEAEHVAAVLSAAREATFVDDQVLVPRLAAYARRLGVRRGDGQAALDELLRLGRAAERAARDLRNAIAHRDGSLRSGADTAEVLRLLEPILQQAGSSLAAKLDPGIFGFLADDRGREMAARIADAIAPSSLANVAAIQRLADNPAVRRAIESVTASMPKVDLLALQLAAGSPAIRQVIEGAAVVPKVDLPTLKLPTDDPAIRRAIESVTAAMPRMDPAVLRQLTSPETQRTIREGRWAAKAAGFRATGPSEEDDEDE